MKFEIHMIVYESNQQRLDNYHATKKYIPELKMFKALDSVRNFEKLAEFALSKNYICKDWIDRYTHRFRGKIGCKLSHLVLEEEFYNNSDKNWLLVLEDDAEPRTKYSTQFVEILISEAESINSHFIDLCMHPWYLEKQLNLPKLTNNLHKLLEQWWSTAILLDKVAIEAMIKKPLNNMDTDESYYARIEEFNGLAYADSLFNCKGAKGRNDFHSEFGSIIWSS